MARPARAYRIVPLGTVVVEALAAHLANYPTTADGFIFTTATGAPLSCSTFNARVWQPAVRAAGLRRPCTI
ncbi:MAG TPA: hypothetical protein VFR11_13125 [Micromonosporaceae bacterium]|jgi:hypothetical protein|nr:hypothetical protein [Micromonosporaceae bacterium]